ncbi:hypothetical protein, partial [Endozoicomonas sp. SESOKO2]|uniref:hypothetical protein n=2 Tax=unclassified Endozoicomonas TaxID=2644528 RepID=UPI0021474592
RLAFRRIELTEERNYFSGMGAPRPFTLALPGGMAPTGRVPEAYGKWMVGIFDPQCLYVYKRNAGTCSLAMMLPELTPENRLVKLLPDLQSVLDRYFERGNQLIWKVYPARFTSGHLNADGTFCLPELKPGYHSTDDDFPELVLTHYKKQDVKCFCVYNDAEINVSDILRDKRQCEKVLRLKPLPLVVYCNRTGSVEVYYDDELDSQYLSMNERSLNDFAFSQGVAPDHFRAMLNLLPMSVRAEALSSERTTTADPDARHKLQQAIDLVNEPGSYDCERLLDLKQRGLPIHQRFFHERGVDSLLEILLCSAMIRNDQPEHEQTREQEEETCRLCWLLLKSGAQLARDFSPLVMMCNTLNPVMPPGIMNYLVAAFAPFDVLTLKHLRRIPLTDCPGSVVEFDRICRECTPQKLQSCLEELLRYPCSFNSPTLDIIQSKLLALYHYGASLDKNVLNRFEADVKHQYPNGKKIINNFSLNDYIRWLNQLYEQRETHPFYQNWPKYVRQAHQDIADLRRSLGLDDSQNLETPSSAEAPAALQFMVDTFSKPPAMPENVGDNEKTILKVLQHYYRRPGPE